MAEKQADNPAFVYSLQGSGTEVDPYQVGSFYDLETIKTISGYNSNKHYVFTNDIVFNDGKFIENEENGEIVYYAGKSGNLYKWVWTSNVTFTNCSFDGQGHSIIGYYGSYFLYSCNNCQIKNINFKNAYEYASGNTAVICYSIASNSLISNCSVEGWAKGKGALLQTMSNSIVENCTNYAKFYGNAGICQYVSGSTIKNCVNYGDRPSLANGNGTYGFGGISRDTYGTCKIINCVNKGNIGKSGSSGGILWMDWGVTNIEGCENYGTADAGIMYSVPNGNGTKAKVVKCINYGECTNGIGGTASTINCKNYGLCGVGIGTAKIIISGCKNYKMSNEGTGIGSAPTIENCINYASVDGGSNAYGIQRYNTAANIIGCVNYGDFKVSTTAMGIGAASNVIDCVNYGNIITGYAAAGIGGSGNYTRCKNYGMIKGGGFSTGGISYFSSSKVKIIECENHGDISGNDRVGGLVGWDVVEIYNSVNYGKVVSNAYAGGLIGAVYPYSSGGKIYNSANYGDVRGGNCGALIGGSSGEICEIKNCIGGGNIKGGIDENSNYMPLIRAYTATKTTITNTIFDGKVKDVITKRYWGSDFSAFYVVWKTGYIGLKALDSVGVYMFAIPSEEYLQERGFVKAG